MTIDFRAVRHKLFHAARKKPFLIFGGLFLLLLIMLLWTESNLRPVAIQMAASRAKYWMSSAIVRAVERVIDEENVNYADLVSFEKDSSGLISAVMTDISRLNRLKNEVTGAALEEIAKYETGEIRIPIGNIINGELLSGRGPSLSVRIIPIGFASTEIENVFEDAGINHTRHRILLCIRAEMTVIIAGRTTSVAVSNEVCIAETVIVGAVPDSYTLITDTEAFDKYNNFID